MRRRPDTGRHGGGGGRVHPRQEQGLPNRIATLDQRHGAPPLYAIDGHVGPTFDRVKPVAHLVDEQGTELLARQVAATNPVVAKPEKPAGAGVEVVRVEADLELAHRAAHHGGVSQFPRTAQL